MNKILLKIPVCAIVLLFYVFISSGNTKENTNNTIDKSSHSTLAELGEAKDLPVELGEVEWIRNFDEATTKAKKLNKPLLVLFQEVPGCSTSSGYGNNVLSHPLIVEAIETLFVPAAIYNNNKGEDERVLKSFGEPSWNNPVVRIMTPERQELVSRLSGDYTKAGLIGAMITALESNNKTVPPYLSLLAQELNVKFGSRERAVFAMHCFWIGEGQLANIKGVISTKPGYMGGYEVVELEFNPEIISFEDLVKKGKLNNVASHIFTVNSGQSAVAKDIVGEGSVSPRSGFRADSKPKYYLSGTLYRYVPMTNLQIARVNASLGSLRSPDSFLSPRQLELYKYIENHQELNWPNSLRSSDFNTAWNKTISLLNKQISRR
ncbi:MAG: VPGUxxT family thioredoxin-like (seleno)protein, type 2 [Candidatus Dadabacteria bacterium]|nr:VPGUxxT family thioredoxin-like (seleno)protein, type 2 [Candidatus Dadabacteria bacterium]